MREQIELLKHHADIIAQHGTGGRAVIDRTPSMAICPSSCRSSLLMQRISVDFPETEGPHMKIFWLSSISRSTSSSARKSPNSLPTPRMLMKPACFAPPIDFGGECDVVAEFESRMDLS